MPRLSKRDQAIRELQRIVAGERREEEDPTVVRFTHDPELRRASAVLGSALAERHQSAFTAATRTPIAAPPGWLPPPI